MIGNEQLKIVAAVRNDGIITLVETNGKHSNEFMTLRYDEQITQYRQERYGDRVPLEMIQQYNIDKEVYTRNLAIKEFAKGGMKEYE